MNEIIFILISVCILYIFYKLLKQSINSFNYPLVSIFFLFKFFVFAYIGTLIHIIIQGYSQNNFYLVQFFLSSLTLIMFPLGMLFVTKLNNFNGDFVYDYKLDYKINDKMFYVFVLLFIISVSVLILFISKLEMLPIIAILKGLGVSYAYELRSAAGNTFPGKYYRYAMFMKDLPFYIMIVLFFLRNISFKWKILFLLFVLLNSFVAVMDIQKAPLMKVFLILILSALFYYKKINWKLFFGIGVGLSISVILMYIFFLGYGSNFGDIIKAFLNRVFFVQIDAFIYHQEYININGFLNGRGLPNPHHIFPFEHIQITTEVFKFKVGNWHEGMPLGSFPTVFYAEWYDNFGYAGAIFSMFLLGALMQLVDIKMLYYINKYKSVIVIGLYIFIIDFFSKYALTGYMGIIIDTHLVFPMLVAISLVSINNYLKKRKKI